MSHSLSERTQQTSCGLARWLSSTKVGTVFVCNFACSLMRFGACKGCGMPRGLCIRYDHVTRPESWQLLLEGKNRINCHDILAQVIYKLRQMQGVPPSVLLAVSTKLQKWHDTFVLMFWTWLCGKVKDLEPGVFVIIIPQISVPAMPFL